MLLHQQYCERFIKYSQYISCLLVARQNNDLLMKNHQFHLTGSKPSNEVNVSALFSEVDTSTPFPKVNASNFGHARDYDCYQLNSKN